MANKKEAIIDTDTLQENTPITTFFMYHWSQFIDGSILIEAWVEKFNATTWKLERDDATTKIVDFTGGIYVTSNDFEIEFLNKYNSWWKLSNGRILKPTPFPKVSTKKFNQEESIVNIKEVTVTKNIIPLSVLDMLDEATLIDMAKNSFDYDIKSESKKDIIKEFKDNWFTV